MNIWEIKQDFDKYERLCIVRGEFDDIFLPLFDGRSYMQLWEPMKVELWKREKKMREWGKELLHTDMPAIGDSNLVASTSILTNIDQLAAKCYEKLQLKSSDGDYTILNITHVIDCLDLERTKYKNYKHVDEIQSIQQYFFKYDVVKDEILFKIKNYSIGAMYCTDAFKELIESFDAKNISFKKVWSYQE